MPHFKLKVISSIVIVLACSCAGCGGKGGDDPPVCGDGICNGDETPASCPQDCSSNNDPVCGDGICNGDETPASCPQDCDEGECNEKCNVSGDVVLCDDDGVQHIIDCPGEVGSTCKNFGGDIGFWCDCGSLEPYDILCHSLPILDTELVSCSEDGFMIISNCNQDLGSSCRTVGGNHGCSCGSVTAAGTCYADPDYPELGELLLLCENDFLVSYMCGQGGECMVVDGQADCYCDNADDGFCPPGDVCPNDPDCGGGNECTVTSFYSGCYCSDCEGTEDFQSCFVNSDDPVCAAEGFSICWKESGLTPDDAICTRTCTSNDQCTPGTCYESIDGASVCIGYRN